MTHYKVVCEFCDRLEFTAFECQAERIAEEHMMATGHIVTVTEV